VRRGCIHSRSRPTTVLRPSGLLNEERFGEDEDKRGVEGMVKIRRVRSALAMRVSGEEEE
jgi:hypothetical protein